MSDLFNSPSMWWLILGVVMFIAEVLGTAGFLIGAGVAALAMAVATWLFPELGIVSQFIYFAISAVMATYIYFKFFRITQPSNKDELPSREQLMIGTQFEVTEVMKKGVEIRMQIGDTRWRIISDDDVAQGTRVEVVAAKAMQLVVEPMD